MVFYFLSVRASCGVLYLTNFKSIRQRDGDETGMYCMLLAWQDRTIDFKV